MVRAGDAEVAAPIVISAVPWHAFARLWDEGVPAAVADVGRDRGRDDGVTDRHRESVARSIRARVRRPGSCICRLRRRPDALDVQQERLIKGVRHLSIVASGADDARANGQRGDHGGCACPDLSARFRRWPAGPCSGPWWCASLARRSRSRRAGRGVRAPSRARGFFLAGDWTDTGLPGTIEGAVPERPRGGRTPRRGRAIITARVLRHRPLRRARAEGPEPAVVRVDARAIDSRVSGGPRRAATCGRGRAHRHSPGAGWRCAVGRGPRAAVAAAGHRQFRARDARGAGPRGDRRRGRGGRARADGGSFRITARRADKRFPIPSPEIERVVGARCRRRPAGRSICRTPSSSSASRC